MFPLLEDAALISFVWTFFLTPCGWFVIPERHPAK
jgi:hypothetical protein